MRCRSEYKTEKKPARSHSQLSGIDMASATTCVSIMVPCVLFIVVLVASSEARIAVPTSDYNLVEGSGYGGRGPSESVSAESSDDSAMPWALGAIRVMRKVYLECQDEELTSCLKVQFIRAMDKVAFNIKEVPLMSGVSLERDPLFQADEKMLSKDELEATLPRSLPDRERSLDRLIMDRVVSFFQNYSLRFKLPAVNDVTSTTGGPGGEEDLDFDDFQKCDDPPCRRTKSGELTRRRRQPLGGLAGLLAVAAGSLLPMKFGMLAMLAGKALMLSKLALIISALMAMRNMGSSASSAPSGHH